MSAVVNRRGQPRPFEMKAIRGSEGQFVQHAIMFCCDCNKMGKFPWTGEHVNPYHIVQKFERAGWEVYKANKARCPQCRHERTKQKAYFAKLNEQEEAPMPELIKITRHVEQPQQKAPPVIEHEPAEQPERTYLVTIASDGTATMRPLDGAKEMLFGNETYLVVPR